jgi:hypothetical protein
MDMSLLFECNEALSAALPSDDDDYDEFNTASDGVCAMMADEEEEDGAGEDGDWNFNFLKSMRSSSPVKQKLSQLPESKASVVAATASRSSAPVRKITKGSRTLQTTRKSTAGKAPRKQRWDSKMVRHKNCIIFEIQLNHLTLDKCRMMRMKWVMRSVVFVFCCEFASPLNLLVVF